MKIVLYPSNILTLPKTPKEDNSELNPMRKITKNHLNAHMAHQEVARKMKENNSEKGDQMKELNYKKLITPGRSKNKNLSYKGRATKS